jgi:hypothetical protein
MVLGPGWLQMSRNNMPGEHTARFGLSINAGYRPLTWLRTGISLGGWTIEPFDYYYDCCNNYETIEGISISNIYAQVQVFPFEQADIYLNLEGGWSQYINMNADGFNTDGAGGKLGIGYEHKMGKTLALTLIANYGLGSFHDIKYPGTEITQQHYNVMEIMLGISIR